ncbi:uncharacterized protein LOC126758986 [Bactrocera neohumeralis]|uniref:uncharacterized protein LOC126758986 n=1 Tax=Bactrocera neohumeralis TaxID=98809 RepID=UPI002165679A|nr:uncharacterized protein LOC126758986 [Bactrocera neohumeralis]
MDIHVRAYQLPVNNISINLSLWHRTNSFQPFLYNQTYDYCKFMKNPTRMPFVKIFFDAIKKSSNINHTCPYNHDLIVKGFVMNDSMFRLLPLPGGTYMFKLRVATLNAWRAEVGVQFLLDLKSK